jgi:hypothetical protein
MSAYAVAELVERLRSVPDQFRAVPTSRTMSTSGVIYTAFMGQFTPHPVAIEAATLIEQQSARLQELEKDAARYRWLRSNCQYAFEDRDEPQLVHRNGETASSQNSRWREDLDAAIDAALAADAGEPL